MTADSAAAAMRARNRKKQSAFRARQKEYKRSLETRLKLYEQDRLDATIEVQLAARRVAEENAVLRRLLAERGVFLGAESAGVSVGVQVDSKPCQQMQSVGVQTDPVAVKESLVSELERVIPALSIQTTGSMIPCGQAIRILREVGGNADESGGADEGDGCGCNIAENIPRRFYEIGMKKGDGVQEDVDNICSVNSQVLFRVLDKLS